MSHSTLRTRLPFAIFFLLLFTLSASAQNFTATSYDIGPGAGKLVRGDFNNDGHEDIASMKADATVTILLNNGDGTFHRVDAIAGIATSSQFALYDIVPADINKDGKLDLVVVNAKGDGTSDLNVLYGRGDGTFNAPVTIGNRQGGIAAGVGDFNGDGNLDIVFGWNSSITTTSGNIENHANVTLFVGDGTGVFHSTDMLNVGAQADYANGESGYQIRYMNTGDFNGDGHTDFAIAECCGGFDVELGSATAFISNVDDTFNPMQLSAAPPYELRVGDLNADGKADLLIPYSGCHTPCIGVSTYFNPGTVAQSAGDLPDPFSSNGETDTYASATVADFTGSGQKTAVYNAEGFYWGVFDNSDTTLLAFSAWNGSGFSLVNTFNAGQTHLQSLIFADWDKDGRNDLAAIASPMDGSSGPQVTIYHNVGGAQIGLCQATTDRSVHLCTPPPGSTVPSPVRVYAGVKSSVGLQTVQVYLDGTKVWQGGQSYTTAIDRLLDMTNGSHKITVKGWDANGSFSQSSTFTVSAASSTSGGGGSTCATTANRTVKICAPTAGSTVSSPVTLTAALRSDSGLKATQVYLDGAKVFQGAAGTKTLNQSYSMGVGTHKFTVKGWDSTGSFSSSVSFTVK